MPSTNAIDTTRACEIRPILLNFMRFLNLAGRRLRAHPLMRANLWGYKCSAYCRSLADFPPLCPSLMDGRTHARRARLPSLSLIIACYSSLTRAEISRLLRKLHWALTLSASLIAIAATARTQIMASPGDLSHASDAPTVIEHLTGVVLNSVTGQPVPGALVTAPGRSLAVLTDYQGRFPFELTRTAEPATGVTSQQSMPIAFQLRK